MRRRRFNEVIRDMVSERLVELVRVTSPESRSGRLECIVLTPEGDNWTSTKGAIQEQDDPTSLDVDPATHTGQIAPQIHKFAGEVTVERQMAEALAQAGPKGLTVNVGAILVQSAAS